MTARISQKFVDLKAEGRAALITYVMASDPDFKTSLEAVKSLSSAGADIIELGMPFSDPMADGPVIQAAAERSLASGGSIKNTLLIVSEFRKNDDSTPVILMGYYNPIMKYGVDAFVKDALFAGADGVIIVDLPTEEEGEFTSISSPSGLDLIKLTTPTTDENRAQHVLKTASGFVYYVAVAGITGTKSADKDNILSQVEMLRKYTDLPIAVGFGIKTPTQAREIAAIADGVVVGSALVKAISEGSVQDGLALVDELSRGILTQPKQGC